MADRNAPVGANIVRFWRSLAERGQVPTEAPPGVVIPGQRRTEDRAAMAAEAAAAFDAEEQRLAERRARRQAEEQYRIEREAADRAARQAWREGASAVTNRPVGAARMTDAAEQPAMPSQRGALADTAAAAARVAGVGTRGGRTGPGEDSPEATEQRDAARNRRPSPPRRRQPQGMSEADRLNEISLAFARGERPRGGAAETIGKALGVEGYKKGGLIGKRKAAAKVVKKAAGGAIQKPKVPGRPAGRPAQNLVKPMGTRGAAKAAKPLKPVAMPTFKKGGKVAAKKRK